MLTEFADSHCHLNYEGLSLRTDEVLQAMAAAGVTRALNICTTLEEADKVLEQTLGRPGFGVRWGCTPITTR